MRIRIFYLIALISCTVHATVKVTSTFSNSMVLQRNSKVRIWGSAANDESVTIQFNNQTKSSVAKNGSWSMYLDTMSAGGPYTMTIKGQNTITISDVYVGEVWQCAGQSNMDTRVSYYPHYSTVMNTTKLPLLRFLTTRQPGGVTNNVWETCTTPEKVGKLSCLGFFFGKEILSALKNNVAVGLVVTAVGGTTIAGWLDPQTLSQNSGISKIDASAGSMYSSWVKPVEGYTIRGTLFMQGEQDRSNGLQVYYKERLDQIINGWRKAWGQGNFPFYTVQLANYGTVQSDPNENASSSVIREAQRLGLAITNTTLTVIIDIGDSLHFGNKQEAGRRLALPARALEYGESTLVYSGPLFVEKIIEGSKVHCRFKCYGSEMKPKSGSKLNGFAIAGADKKYVWADAVIHGDTVTVSSSSVTKPANVRYAYGGNPIGNLINSEGLPASPFTTDGPQLPIDTFKTAVSFSRNAASVHNVRLAKNTVSITLPKDEQHCRIQLVSLKGSLVIDKKFSFEQGSRLVHIPSHTLTSGCYMVVFTGEKNTFSEKISITQR
ncbi:MAG TPA: sialate O-acetylesterase [Chitinispirillaceae bacterium]|nr:sialate O-acetylesterase [Chitinispirillaceae bacterium]